MDYSELQRKVSEQKVNQKTRYDYARSLGFTALEARLLMGHSFEDIDRIHADKIAKEA